MPVALEPKRATPLPVPTVPEGPTSQGSSLPVGSRAHGLPDAEVDTFVGTNPAAVRPKLAPLETSTKLREVADALANELALHNPIMEAFRSEPTHPMQLNDPSPGEFLRHFSRMDAIERDFRSLPLHSLGPEEKLIAEWVRLAFRHSRALQPSNLYQWQIGTFTELHPLAGLWGLLDTIDSRADLLKIASCLHQAPRVLAQLEENLRSAKRRGQLVPKIVVNRMIADLDREIAAAPGRSEYREVAKRLSPGWRLSDRLWARRTLRDASSQGLTPALRQFRDFLANELIGRDSIGLCEMPEGAALYDACAFRFTGSTRSADEWHRLGLEQVARLREEMTTAGQRLVPTAKSFKEVIEGIAQAEPPGPKNQEELSAHIAALVEKAEAVLPAVWGQDGRELEPLTVVGQDQGGTEMASYLVPAGADTGFMIFDLTSREPAHNWAHVVLHEYTHHLQQEVPPPFPDLPALVRDPLALDSNLYDTAVAEGQALYTEKIAAELGLYETELEKFAQLNAEMERAVRLVVDTGIHAKGWSRDEALHYYRAHTTFGAQTAENEIDRYIANPGQALSYMAGLLEIEAMRAKAERELGGRFDLRSFNAALLSVGGDAPMAAVKDAVDRWITAQETSKTG